MNSENKKSVSNLWVFLTAFGIFNVIIFYHAGIKSKSGKYIKVGHFYLLLIFLSIFINLNISFITNIVLFLYLAGYVFGLLFAVKTFPSYKKRLTMLNQMDANYLNNKKIYLMNNQNLEDFIKNSLPFSLESTVKTSVFTNSDNSKPDVYTENIEDEYLEYTGEKIKINSDPEEKLADLPFITKELVRKIILERKLGSGFRNEADLRNKLGLNDRNAKILERRIDFSFDDKQQQ